MGGYVMKTMYLSENGKYYCEESSNECVYHNKKEITEHEYNSATESLYYYQLIGQVNDPLNGFFSCCGLVHKDAQQKEFYINHFLTHDSRYGMHEKVNYISKLVIVKGFRGNVAGRDGLPITSESVIQEYQLA
jgi:hypothetical protein